MRDLPRAIAISCVIVLLIYVLTIVSFHTTLSTAEVTFPFPLFCLIRKIYKSAKYTDFLYKLAKYVDLYNLAKYTGFLYNLETVRQNLLLMLSQQTELKHYL